MAHISFIGLCPLHRCETLEARSAITTKSDNHAATFCCGMMLPNSANQLQRHAKTGDQRAAAAAALGTGVAAFN